MAKYTSKKGWYRIVNTNKFIRPIDEYMESTKVSKDGMYVQYKSKLERIAFHYADINPKIRYFSVEPFHIQYVKPTDGRYHRYFIDMFIEFVTGDKFLVEIKSSSETKPPLKPKTKSGIERYKEAVQTFMINTAKWKKADEFARSKGMKFIILTENELK